MSDLPYRKLEVWQRAKALGIAVMKVGRRPPMSKDYWFRDQMGRSAMSVAANVAEGAGRGRPLDFAAFVDRARASLFELDTWSDAALELEYITRREHAEFGTEIRRISAMLRALRNRLRRQGGEIPPGELE